MHTHLLFMEANITSKYYTSNIEYTHKRKIKMDKRKSFIKYNKIVTQKAF